MTGNQKYRGFVVKFGVKWIFAGAVISFLGLFALAAFLAQDNIARFLINPREPYDTYTPPPAPDYGRPSSWLLFPQNLEGAEAAVFYVHSTTYRSAAHWNAPILDKKSGSLLSRISVPNEAGPFRSMQAVFAPRYRQATLYGLFTSKYQGRAARLTAYWDVRRAFEVFLESVPDDMPIILVGYGQGGLHVQGLLMDYFQQGELLRRRLVVAYIIDHATPLDMFEDELAKTPPCAAPDDIRCVISWTSYAPDFGSEIERLRNSSLVFDTSRELDISKDRPLLCTNPLNWKIDGEAPASEHDGAASATGLRYEDEPAIIKNNISVTCENGVALLSKTSKRYLRRPKYLGKKWAPLTYNMFYDDIRQNVTLRVDQWREVWTQEEKRTPPIDSIEDIPDAPINKVPG
jgi:DUF3089 family protein